MRDLRRIHDALLVIARGLGGELDEGDRFRPPRLRLQVKGVLGHVLVVPRPSAPLTQVAFPWKPAGVLRVGFESFLTRIGKLFGTKDIQVADSDFDRRFLVQGDSAAWVRRTLDGRTRLAIHSVADACRGRRGTSALSIDLGRAGLRVVAREDLSLEPVRLAYFVEAAVELMRALHRRESAGVRILDVEESAGEGNCPTCGDALRPPLRRCGACRTLHHQDCWEYLGGCAIFACCSARGRRAEQRAARRAAAEADRRSERPTRVMRREAPARRQRRRRSPRRELF